MFFKTLIYTEILFSELMLCVVTMQVSREGKQFKNDQT